MKAWYFEPKTREWKEIRGGSFIGAMLARRLGYRVAIQRKSK